MLPHAEAVLRQRPGPEPGAGASRLNYMDNFSRSNNIPGSAKFSVQVCYVCSFD